MKSLLFLSTILAFGVVDRTWAGSGCKDVKKADIMVAMDSSMSVKEDGWQKQLEFLTKMIDGLTIGQDAVRVGLVRFSTDAHMIFKLDKYTEKESLKDAVKQVEYKPGVTRTNKGMRLARSLMKPDMGARPNVQKVLIVLTDGQSSEPEETKAEAAKVHKQKNKVIAIGVGRADKEELKIIASDPKFVLHTKDANSLIESHFIENKVLDSIKCASKCEPIQRADVVMLVDVSGSIKEEGFKNQKYFVKAIIKSLKVSKDNVHLGLVAFSQFVKESFGLDKGYDMKALISEVDNMWFQKATTNTHLALEQARTVYFTKKRGARKDVPKILIVLTDGEATEHDEAIEEAQKVKAMGIRVIVIAVGDNIDMEELEAISSYKQVIRAKDHKVLEDNSFIKDQVMQEVDCAAETEIQPKCSIVMSKRREGL